MSAVALLSMAAKNSDVPDLAIVPKWLRKSALVIPTPVSVIVRIPRSLSATMVILRSGLVDNAFVLVRDKNRILSSASDPF